MAGEIRTYKTKAVQKQVSRQHEHGECVKLVIEFAEVIVGHRRNGNYELISRTRNIAHTFLNLKRAKSLMYKRIYAPYIDSALLWMRVPREERDRAVPKIFEVIYKAVSPEQPIFVVVECLIERDLEPETPMCAICLEDLAEREEEEGIVTSMPCAHRYHQQCIDAWLIMNPLCPLCRHPCMPSKP